MKVNEFIKNKRILRQLSLADVAKAVGVSEPTVSRWESGDIDDMRRSRIAALADVLHIDPIILIRDDIDASKTVRIVEVPNSNAIRVPVYGTVPAGIPVEAIENIIDYEEIPREMTAGGKEYFGLRVKGDSMIPDFHDGDTILLMRQSDCENGQVAVACVDGNDATLKKIIKQDDAIILQPLNHAYEPIIYRTDDEENPVTILGVVVEIRRKYNGA